MKRNSTATKSSDRWIEDECDRYTRVIVHQIKRMTESQAIEAVQYVTNQQGERVGVLLDLETYQCLAKNSASDEELLIGLSLEELQALATSQLANAEQVRLSELLAQNAEGQLAAEASAKLDQLLTQVDHLNILKTRARYTLQQLYGASM